MAILTNSGRIATAASVKAQKLYLAWGAGVPLWDTLPVPESINDTALIAEIGRREASYVGYAVPDPAGDIELPSERFRLSEEPTRHLFMRFSFDYLDAPASTIRELAVFVGASPKAGLPPGQRYFTPSQMADFGRLLLLERIKKFERLASVRQMFEFVVTF